MKFATFAKIAAVAGVMIASVFGQSLSAQAAEQFTMGYTKVEWQYVSPNTRFAADLTVMDDGSATGVIQIHTASDVTLKRGTFGAATGAIVCSADEPVMIFEGTYSEEIDGRVVNTGPARAEVRMSRPTGGGGGVIVGDFDIIDAAATSTSYRAVGEITSAADPCR